MGEFTTIPRRTLVAVRIPKPYKFGTEVLDRFNGFCYTVKDVKKFKGHPYYALNECESDYGINYWFAQEWLGRLDG